MEEKPEVWWMKKDSEELQTMVFAYLDLDKMIQEEQSNVKNFKI